jgi:O-antigen ligase
VPDRKSWIFVATLFVFVAAFYFAFSRPYYFADVLLLRSLVFLQLLTASLWRYCKVFFGILVIVFLSAGTAVPMHEVWTSLRWAVLGAGAAAGVFLFLRGRQRPFGFFHLLAFACILSAGVSALVSSYPEIALLKAASLCLLFIYGMTGVRLALFQREEQFFSALIVGCEVLVCVTAIAYLMRIQLFGNRNSLGVAMGVIALPILLWGYLVSVRAGQRRRRMVALLICQILLLSSYERAGIIAALISSSLLCVGLKRYRLLVSGMVVTLAMAVGVAAFVPPPSTAETDDGSLASRFVYKGERQAGMLGSRKSVWTQTLSSLHEHPWFGTGFGTSLTAYDKTQVAEKFSSAEQVTREHGNSYLEIAEWAGLFGSAPFFLLLLLLVGKVARIFAWMRRTSSPFSPAVPLAIFVAGALANAGFEDWLFAVGYHTCVIFWSFAFLLPDCMPAVRNPHTWSTYAIDRRRQSLPATVSA